MANLVSATTLRALVPSPLTDLQLDAIIARVENEIIQRYGSHYAFGSTVTETVEGTGQYLFLQRRFSGVTSVTEDGVLLATTDYTMQGRSGMLRRYPSGSTWGESTVVVYTPVDDSLDRTSVIIELCRLVLASTAYQSESIGGEWSYTVGDLLTRHASLLRTLGVKKG